MSTNQISYDVNNNEIDKMIDGIEETSTVILKDDNDEFVVDKPSEDFFNEQRLDDVDVNKPYRVMIRRQVTNGSGEY